MRVNEEGMSYEKWVEGLEFYIMSLGLTEEEHAARCLGLVDEQCS